MGLFSPEQMDKLCAEMSAKEHSVSNLDKLSGEAMCREIRTALERMEALVPELPQKWPEFSILASSIRGYAFNAFRITTQYCIRDLQRKQQLHRPTPKIEDFLL